MFRVLNGDFRAGIQSFPGHLPASGCGGMFHVIFSSRWLTLKSTSWQISGQTGLPVCLIRLQYSTLRHGFLVQRWILLEKVCEDKFGCTLIWRLFTTAFTAAFDYQFGALADAKNDLMEAYMGLMYVGCSLFFQAIFKWCHFFFRRILICRSDTLGSPSRSAILMQTVLPVWILQLISKYSNRRSLKHARHTAEIANAVTRQLIELKSNAALQGKGNKDIFSLLGWYSNPFGLLC